MQVEADRDRHTRPDCGAYPAQKFALAVVELLGHHRTMQVEIDAIDRQGGLETIDHVAGDTLEGVGRHPVRRRGRRPYQAYGLMTGRVQRVERPGRGDVGASHRARDIRAAADAGPAAARLECRVVRRTGGEGVGFVLKAAYSDARHAGIPQVRG